MQAATRTEAERKAHLAALETAILDGAEPTEAVAAHATKFGLSLKRARRDLAVLRNKWKRFARRATGRADEQLGMSLIRGMRLYGAALAKNDMGAAVEAERHLAELTGLVGGKSK